MRPGPPPRLVMSNGAAGPAQNPSSWESVGDPVGHPNTLPEVLDQHQVVYRRINTAIEKRAGIRRYGQERPYIAEIASHGGRFASREVEVLKPRLPGGAVEVVDDTLTGRLVDIVDPSLADHVIGEEHSVQHLVRSATGNRNPPQGAGLFVISM